MSAPRDYAKRAKTSKKRAKAASGQRWKIVLLMMTCLAIVLVYYARNDLQKIQLQRSAIAPIDEAAMVAKPKFEFYSKVPAAPVIADKSANRKSHFQIRVATFKLAEDAERLKAELTLDGFTVSVKPVGSVDKQVYLRVTVGPYDSVEKARDALLKLQSENYRGVINRVT